jgi:uncharacterized protein
VLPLALESWLAKDLYCGVAVILHCACGRLAGHRFGCIKRFGTLIVLKNLLCFKWEAIEKNDQVLKGSTKKVMLGADGTLVVKKRTGAKAGQGTLLLSVQEIIKRGHGHQNKYSESIMVINSGKKFYDLALKIAEDSNPDLFEVERLLIKSIKLNNPDAHFALGSWYFFGKHVPKSIEKSISLWEKGASVGSVESCLELALLYEKGDIIPPNLNKTLYFYVMAAALGSGQAYYEMSRSFFYGIFTPQSYIIYENMRDKADELGFEERPE